MIEIVREFFVDVMDEDDPLLFLHPLEDVFESFICLEIGTVISFGVELDIFPYLVAQQAPRFGYLLVPSDLFSLLRFDDRWVRKTFIDEFGEGIASDPLQDFVKGASFALDEARSLAETVQGLRHLSNLLLHGFYLLFRVDDLRFFGDSGEPIVELHRLPKKIHGGIPEIG